LTQLKNSENAPSLSGDELDTLRDFLLETAVADVYYAFDSENASSASDATNKTVFDEIEIETLYDTELYGLTKIHKSRRIDTNQPQKKDMCEICHKDDNGIPECYNTVYEYLTAISGKEEADLHIGRVYTGVLELHHKDGNHLNNEEGNHLTVCSNIHRVETMYNEHYNNRYLHIK
jgi:hypothetical protein